MIGSARIRKAKSGLLKAECNNCGRFLAEVHGTTYSVAKCPNCKSDNSIRVCYSNPNKRG